MVTAHYFNGKDARTLQVSLHPAPGLIQIRGEGVVRSEPISAVRISSKLGHAPRLVYFSDGSHCEIADHAGFEALLYEAGMKPYSLLARLEANWRHAFIATLLFLALVFSLFQWGLPWAADVASAKVPHDLALRIDTDFLKSLGKQTLKPSKVGLETQERLTHRLQAWRGLDGVEYSLKFRDSPVIGPNAFALPGGTVVVTDQLVKLANDDDEVLAVLAHELGHVSGRHPMRQLLQGTVVGLVMTWYLGDISSLLATAPTVLLQSSYSRDFERSADHYAVEKLRANGIAPTKLADILEKLEANYHARKQRESNRAAAAKKSGQPVAQTKPASGVGAGQPAGTDQDDSANEDEEGGIMGYFASHPATSERIREIRGAAK